MTDQIKYDPKILSDVYDNASQDPKWKSFSPEDQMDIVHQYYMQTVNTIPPWRQVLNKMVQEAPNTLQNFIQNTMGIPQKAYESFSQPNFMQNAVRAFTPQSQQEWSDVPNIAANATGLPALYNMMNKNPIAGFVGLGARGQGINLEEPHLPDFPQPSTPWGQEMNKFVGNAELATGGALGLKSLGQGIGSLFDVDMARRKMLDAVSKGAESAEKGLSKFGIASNEAMGRGLVAIEDTGLHQGHINDALKKTAFKVDPTGTTHSQPGSLANHILSHVEPVSSEISAGPNIDYATGVTSALDPMPSPTMSGPQLQAKIVDVTHSLARHSQGSKAVGEFGNQLSQILPKSMLEVRGARASAYGAAEAAESLTKVGTLNKIAKGLIGLRDLGELQTAEKNVPGLNSIQNIIKSGSNFRRTQGLNKLLGIGETTAGANVVWHGMNWLIKKLTGY